MKRLADGLTRGSDDVARCFWCGDDEGYMAYHDTEWGFPVDDGRRLFEKICLEGFQAGLSWLTILRKRENFRRGFANFDVEKVARFGARDVTRLMNDAGIVRHRGKIESTINNAKRTLEVIEGEGSLARYLWKFEPTSKMRPRKVTRATLGTMMEASPSLALAKDLKQRGFSFVAPTTMYALMQAMGLVNDHLDGCATRVASLAARRAFELP